VVGVTGVDASGLEIEWWARDRFRRSLPAIYQNDEEIERAVRDAFLFDPRVAAHEPAVRVSVDEGTVTLSGPIGNLDAKQAAQEDARNTVGVLWVINNLEVHPKKPIADELLEERIRRAFDMDPVLRDKEAIAVSVSKGVAKLTGEVSSHSEKVRAGREAARQQGVTEVENALVVSARDLSDEELRAAIKDDLVWNPYVVSVNVMVLVDEGTVTLRGVVADWHAYQEAADVARKAGARRVVNELRVNEPPELPRGGAAARRPEAVQTVGAATSRTKGVMNA